MTRQERYYQAGVKDSKIGNRTRVIVTHTKPVKLQEPAALKPLACGLRTTLRDLADAWLARWDARRR
jgi:hypothetical protein